MNHIQQAFIQSIMKQQQHEKQQQVKQEENNQKQNIQVQYFKLFVQYLQKQQLLSIIQQCQQQQQPIQQASKSPTLIEVQNQVTSYFQKIILQKQTINLNNVLEQQLPYFLQIMGNLIIYGLENCPGEKEIVQEMISQYKSNPLKITMSCSLFQTIGLLFRSQLVYYDQCTKYLTNFLLFRDDFCDIFFNTLYCYQITQGQTFSQQIGFTQINQMLKKTQDDVWTAFIFKMLSQQQQKMTKDMFLLQFNQYTVSMNNFFTKSNLIMDLVAQSVKQTSKLHNDQIFQEYLLIMGSFKATTQDFLKKATQLFFEESNDLDLLQFSNNIIKIHKQMNCQILFILPMLFLLESQYLDHLVQNGIQEQQPVKNSSNYYLKMIEKLKNKCVYNGEEECNCKKCQCIRRNRNSAKESQKKKREALEKIGPLQDEYDKIQKKVQSLETENQVITKLLLDVFRHPSLEKLAAQFIEPLAKIIADQDFNNIDEC
ncbi:unnamed protein product (macronuclear) [Paramecium tetraurelia]|uniref:BZIP domain-containing protein n=1 Tax=Paramecium tetraurelia TaxID=5888 RepID=A0DND7_PARTE|nr:uncharacterized protein GSPATT00018750001 [Paramecium tetraurelia]CAK84554.1 unnamed protein product [Paramecium tetraurelia]|eukprot:XP_001451951.1 hypothetical protein (macronuclear) [Paramecium tetraurelia strain d4-2]